MATDYIAEQFKLYILERLDNHSFVALSDHLFSMAKEDFAMHRPRASKAINELVRDGKVALRREHNHWPLVIIKAQGANQ